MKRKKSTPPKTYKGAMKFPLYGAETQSEFQSVCEFTGDFAIPTKRHQIFKRPRYYKVEIHLKIAGTNEWDIQELTTPNDKLDKFMLSQLMHIYAVDGIKELTLGAERQQSEYANVAIDESFFKVIL